MSKMLNIQPGAASTQPKTFDKKEKEPTFGLTKPLTVKWEKDQVVGPYIEIVVANSETRAPTEFVISKLIGKSNTIPKDAMVVNRRKDVPELIKGAGDPMKKRIQAISDEMDLKALLEKGYLSTVGSNHVFTAALSQSLAGQDWTKYLDRTRAEFDSAKAHALAEHTKSEEGKPFRNRKKFVFQRIFDDFMTKDEQAVRAAIQGVILEPSHREKVAVATKSNYETLIDNERQQQLLVLQTEDWKYLNQTGLANELEKTILSVLKGTYQAMKPEEALIQAQKRAVKLEFVVQGHEEALKRVHDFYKSSNDVIAGLHSRIQNDQKVIEELSEEREDMAQHIAELEARIVELEADAV